MATPPKKFPFSLIEKIKPYLNPYYMTVAAVLGGITTVFGALIVVLIIIATNFNVLGWME